ncbi:MAG: hypothetical protein ABIV51_04560, partial [Saprospiraceae bacterium]
ARGKSELIFHALPMANKSGGRAESRPDDFMRLYLEENQMMIRYEGETMACLVSLDANYIRNLD